jgi:DNA-binding response OmpR family regulator
MTLQRPLKRLLVVEDDPDQCSAVRDRLELYGYAVSCAADGSAAMEMMYTGFFDGILLDLNLPSVPGMEVLAAARHAVPHVPVLVMSASQSRLQAAKDANGACAYMSKPFNIAEFKEAIHGCFGPASQPVVC